MWTGRKQNIKNEQGSYYLTMTVVGWVDVFTRENHRKVIIDSLEYCIKEKGLNVYAYCLMSNHLHIIVNVNAPFSLSDTIRDFKKFTAKKIIEQIRREPESRREWMLPVFEHEGQVRPKNKRVKFWKDGNHAIELVTDKFTWTKINYIHQNPVQAGLVAHPHDWVYSSATNYMELESVLPEVFCLQHRLITY